jgi:integrase
MPRRPKPPRLYLRPDRAGERSSTWVILDRGREISTGAAAEDISGAEAALAAYIGGKHRPITGPRDPSQVLIVDVLADYAEGHARSTRRPEIIGRSIERLSEFFGIGPASTVNAELCAQYTQWRANRQDMRAKIQRTVSAASARRELSVLGAALTWGWRNGRIDRLMPIKLPPATPARQRHLTRSEAARLLLAALGWDLRTGQRNPHRISRHLARFILLGVYTGTRHDALLGLQWMPNTTGGWVDLEAGILYRRPQGTIESAKRRPPLPIPPRLMPHLRRWRRLSAWYVIEYAGGRCEYLRRSWRESCNIAGLGKEVVPHVMRHTCATWLLQLGKTTHDVGGVLGTTEAVIERVYGHHAQAGLKQTVAAFSYRGRRP